MLSQLSNKNNKQFFVDITYKIIPFKYQPYKLLTIKTFNIKRKNIKLCVLIAYKFEDEFSLYYTLKYIKEFFNFRTEIISIDFSLQLYKAIKTKSLFDKDIKVISCSFSLFPGFSKKNENIKNKKYEFIKKRIYNTFKYSDFIFS